MCSCSGELYDETFEMAYDCISLSCFEKDM